MMPKQVPFVIDTEDGKKEFLHNVWSPMKCFSNLPKIGKAFGVPLTMMLGGG